MGFIHCPIFIPSRSSLGSSMSWTIQKCRCLLEGERCATVRCHQVEYDYIPRYTKCGTSCIYIYIYICTDNDTCTQIVIYVYIHTYLEHVCPLFWGVFHPPEKDCSVNVRVIWVMNLTTGNMKLLLNGSWSTTLSKFQVQWSVGWHHPKGNLVAKLIIWRKDIHIEYWIL